MLKRKLNMTGMSRSMPKMFCLRGVQRHTAASKSTRPARREQQGITGGSPKVMFTVLFSKLVHMPSLSSSRGQEEASKVLEPPERLVGLGLGFGFGFGFGPGHGPWAETTAKKRRLSVRKREEQVLEPIFFNYSKILVNYQSLREECLCRWELFVVYGGLFSVLECPVGWIG